jgi:hypothetical protein
MPRNFRAQKLFGNFWLTIQNTTNRHVSNAFDLMAVFISFPLARAAAAAAVAADFRCCCWAPPRKKMAVIPMLRVEAWVLLPNALKCLACSIVVLEESSSEISNLSLYELLNSTNS